MSLRRQKGIWPSSTPVSEEDAIFTIILHPEIYLFKAGGKIQGDVYIHFKDTKEDISFQSLKVYLRENINLPEIDGSKKNVTAKVVDEQILIDRDKALHMYSYYISEIKDSKEVRVSFEIHLPSDLASSFNSKQLSTCYELRAELRLLNLCGELCDMTTSQPIEIKEVLAESLDKSQRAQIQQTVKENQLTFSAKTDKLIYHSDDEMKIEFYLDVPNIDEVDIYCELIQMIELKEKSNWETIITNSKQTYAVRNIGILEKTITLYLENSSFSSQPSAHQSQFVVISYAVRLSACIHEETLELEVPFIIERERALCTSYQQIVSAAGFPLLPLTITVNDLKTDGLQSYIPLKRCYENQRLTVRKGKLRGINAVLTIVSESYKPYTPRQKIKGYVYLKINNAREDMRFSNLIILLVGVKRNENGSTLRSRNGEMFLFERKILKGDINENASEVYLSKKSGLMVVEFEFDLSKINKKLPSTFNSEEVHISYELKADVFNLAVGKSKASLYTTLPIIIKEERSKLDYDVSALRNISKVSGKEVSIFLTMDKSVYHHNDVVQARISIDNKSKRQLTLTLQLVQETESFGLNHVVNDTIVSKQIMLLILPKSKMLTTEHISLKDMMFHQQPSLSEYEGFTVRYKLVIDAPFLNNSDLKEIPIQINRRFGHTIKELTQEGFPLLPITLELYGRDKINIPGYLEDYQRSAQLKILNSVSCSDRWKGWKLTK